MTELGRWAQAWHERDSVGPGRLWGKPYPRVCGVREGRRNAAHNSGKARCETLGHVRLHRAAHGVSIWCPSQRPVVCVEVDGVAAGRAHIEACEATRLGNNNGKPVCGKVLGWFPAQRVQETGSGGGGRLWDWPWFWNVLFVVFLPAFSGRELCFSLL